MYRRCIVKQMGIVSVNEQNISKSFTNDLKIVFSLQQLVNPEKGLKDVVVNQEYESVHRQI